MMRILDQAWKRWKRIGQFLGDQIARVILSIFYFTIVVPFGLGVRLLGNPLGIKAGSQNGWIERSRDDSSIESARRMF